jgi:hypothetical protein
VTLTAAGTPHKVQFVGPRVKKAGKSGLSQDSSPQKVVAKPREKAASLDINEAMRRVMALVRCSFICSDLLDKNKTMQLFRDAALFWFSASLRSTHFDSFQLTKKKAAPWKKYLPRKSAIKTACAYP